jgi:hypothetical protein
MMHASAFGDGGATPAQTVKRLRPHRAGLARE